MIGSSTSRSTVRALKTPLELITRVIDYLLEKYCAGCVLCSKLLQPELLHVMSIIQRRSHDQVSTLSASLPALSASVPASTGVLDVDELLASDWLLDV